MPSLSKDQIRLIRTLETQIYDDLKNANNLIQIMAIINDNIASFSVVIIGTQALRRIFMKLFKSGETTTLNKKRKIDEKSSAVDTYLEWLNTKFEEFVDMLLLLLHHGKSCVQVASFRSLMGVALQVVKKSDESQKILCTKRLKEILKFILCTNSENNEGLRATFCEFISKFDDVLSYSLIMFKTLIESNLKLITNEVHLKVREKFEIKEVKSSSASKSKADGRIELNVSEAFQQNFLRNLSKILVETNITMNSEIQTFGHFSKPLGSPKVGRKRNRDSTQSVKDETSKMINYDRGQQKSLLSRCWMALLSQSFSNDIYEFILLRMAKCIIPNISQPLVLADFLTDSYNIGGNISLLALEGLFVLISEFEFEYPNFYSKLYALIRPGIFKSEHRGRFLKLLNLFLSSSYLPAYIVAAFAKRLCRISLTVPLHGCVFICAFVFNLTLRYPVIKVLVDRINSNSESTENVPGTNHKSPNNSNKQINQEKITFEAINEKHTIEIRNPILYHTDDSFLESEDDMSKCHAIDSSFWELDFLKKRNSLSVSELADQFFKKNPRQVPFQMENYYDVSFQSIIDKGSKRSDKESKREAFDSFKLYDPVF